MLFSFSSCNSLLRPRQVVCLTVLLGLLAVSTHAQLFYPSNGDIQTLRASQLWYNGYWKHPGWINGTLVPHSAPQLSGRIVALFGSDILAPYDKWVDQYSKEGALALVVIRERSGPPGKSMYLITGQDQSSFTIPVVEVHQLNTEPHQLAKSIPKDGVYISLWPQDNPWKRANETAFQVVLSVLLCLMELVILTFAALRLRQWATLAGYSLKSIGPICIILESISCLLRLAFTIVDPFWTYRTLPDTPAQVLMTISFPFLFTGGILLTFFWAEALTTSRIHVTPFISEYKKSAFAVIALLFIIEIISTSIRLTIPSSSFDTAFIAQAFYAIVAIILTICYIICAVKITNRLSLINKKRSQVRKMMIRFVTSTGGYITFVIFLVLSIFTIKYPWGFKICANGTFFAANLSGLLQMYSFKPPQHSQTTASSGGIGVSFQAGTRTNSAGEVPRKRTDYSRSISSPRPENKLSNSSETSHESNERSSSPSEQVIFQESNNAGFPAPEVLPSQFVVSTMEQSRIENTQHC